MESAKLQIDQRDFLSEGDRAHNRQGAVKAPSLPQDAIPLGLQRRVGPGEAAALRRRLAPSLVFGPPSSNGAQGHAAATAWAPPATLRGG